MPEQPPRPPAECANCGASIPPHAKACPECGADERTGWRETSVYDDVDLPETAFDDDTSAPFPRRPAGSLPCYWIVIGLLLLAAIFCAFVLR